MRKRLSSKLLSVILTIAICATTVFGCLMTASAADSCYSFGTAEVNADLTETTIDVTFTAPANLPNGFLAGAFSINEVDADGADYLTIKSVSGSGVSATLEGDYVVFNADAAVKTATFELAFGFSKGTATKGKEYKVQLSGVELAYNDKEYYVESATGAIGTISTECDHVIGVVGEPIKVDTANNYSVYENSVCTLCGEKFGIQLVPSAEKLVDDGANGTATGKVVYWDNTKTAPTSTAAGTKDDPIIINTPAELAYIATATNSKATVNPDKYYKIADDVKAFVLQSETYGAEIMALSGSDAVRDYFGDTSKSFYQWQGVSDTTNIFSGHFDGNGITVYGLYNTQANKRQGLFGEVDGNATICNVNVKGAYITTTTGWLDQGAIVGSNRNKYGVGPGTGGQDTLVIKKCSVVDCYMRSSDTANDNRAANGVVVGRSPTGVIMIDNCFISGNDAVFTNNTLSQEYALYGSALNSWNVDSSSAYFKGAYDYYYPTLVENGSCVCNLVVNTVSIGTYPYHLGYYGNRLDNKECFINVYTDAPAGKVANSYVASGTTYNLTVDYAENQIANVAPENFKGAAAVIAMPNLDWGKTWLIGENGGYPYLADPDYTTDTIYWDGTVAAGIVEGTGTDTDPFVINSVSEFAYVVGLGNETEGKYYKFADGIKNVVLQSYAYANDIMALDSAADVQAYFESGNITPKAWIYKGWAANAFSGKFDGNGATVHGMYSVCKDGVQNYNPALFPTIDNGAEISNLALKNSYVYGCEGWDAGLISVIVASGDYGNGKNNGYVKFNDITVANNYMRYYTNRGAIFFASAQGDVATFENILVYGNDAKNMTGDIPSLAIGMKNDLKDAEGNFMFASYKNMLVFGALPYYTSISWRTSEPQCFSNVYTDAPAGEVYAGHPFAENQVKSVPVADILGSKAQTSMPNLAWGTDWYCGTEGNCPVLAPFATFGANKVSTFEHQLYGSSVTYNDDGTLDFNLHFVPQYEGVKATLLVGTADASKVFELTSTESSYRDDLGDKALMFTLPNISARDIDKVWLPTIVVEGGEKTEWGRSQPIALVDNSKAILLGDYDDADKQVAAALINYAATADDALSTPSTEKDVATKVVYAPNNASDSSIIDGTHGTGTETDPYIISTYGHWRFVAEQATYEQTYGKFFKVDPTIKMFVFQQENFIKKVGGLDAFLALDGEGVKEVFENGDAYGRYIMRHNNGGAFAGTLDGSGVQIVGMSGVYYNSSNVMQKGTGGLFGKIHEDATIKNLTISHTYNNTGDLNGVLIGWVANHSAASDNVRKITIENVVLHDNYQITTANGLARSGILIGRVDPGYIAIYLDGIISYDNLALGQRSKDTSVEGYSDMLPCGLVGWYSSAWNGGTANPNGSYKNIISLGNAPYPVASQANQGTKPEYWSNVYTDTITSFTPCTQSNVSSTHPANQWSSYDITVIDAGENNANIKNGKAIALCPKLDWVNKWIGVTDNGYPAPVQKDIDIKTEGSTIYWSGNKDNNLTDEVHAGTTQDGTADNPIIIDNAEELAYIASAGPTVTQFYNADGTTHNEIFTGPKHFKIADGIDKIVLQKPSYSAILELSSLEETRKYFAGETGVSGFTKWAGVAGWQGGDPATYPFEKRDSFCGIFDGNGVEIYGIYMNGSGYGGLFGDMDGNSAVKNVTVKNSYITVATANAGGDHRVAAIVSHCDKAIATGGANGTFDIETITIENCKVENCYMSTPDLTERSGGKINCGVLAANMTESKLVVNNSIVVDSEAYYDCDDTNVKSKLIGVVHGNSSNNYKLNNSIILGVNPGANNFDAADSCFSVVYTDQDVSNATITKVTDLSTLKGSEATNIVKTLNTNGTVWYVGATGDYPGFKKAGNVPAAYQTKIDAVKFDTPDVVGDGTEYNSAGNMVFGVYQTALSLKANPYMSFAFAFYGDYKTNRDKIKIRFTYTLDGALTTSGEIAVPAYTTGEDIKNVNGWTNTTANGRFHTFKAECIPVEALAYGIKVEASYDGGAWQDFGTYGVEGLGIQFDSLNKTEPSDYYATRVEAAKALLFYAQAIAARYGA